MPRARGLDGLLRTRTHDISGILNGVDKPCGIRRRIPPSTRNTPIAKFTGKAKCKAALQERVGLAREPDALAVRRGEPADRAEGD